jgi:hypothetical protein
MGKATKQLDALKKPEVSSGFFLFFLSPDFYSAG